MLFASIREWYINVDTEHETKHKLSFYLVTFHVGSRYGTFTYTTFTIKKNQVIMYLKYTTSMDSTGNVGSKVCEKDLQEECTAVFQSFR